MYFVYICMWDIAILTYCLHLFKYSEWADWWCGKSLHTVIAYWSRVAWRCMHACAFTWVHVHTDACMHVYAYSCCVIHPSTHTHIWIFQAFRMSVSFTTHKTHTCRHGCVLCVKSQHSIICTQNTFTHTHTQTSMQISQFSLPNAKMSL